MNVYFDYHTPTDIDTNEDAINNSIRNIILTRIGSMPGKPDFGSRVIEQVFNLMDGKLTEDLLKNAVLQALLKWEPRINILDIVVTQLPEYNRVIIDVYYEFVMMGKNIGSKASIVISD